MEPVGVLLLILMSRQSSGPQAAPLTNRPLKTQRQLTPTPSSDTQSAGLQARRPF